MKKLSLSEFRDYCAMLSFGTIIFSTDNQSWNCVDSTVAAGLVFNKMTMTFNPNIIHLSTKRNSIQFKKVKAIKLHENKCLLGEVFTIICGDLTKANDIEYTLIAQ